MLNPLTKVYMSFVINIAQNFKEFLLPLQSVEPKIHVLHGKCTKLIKDLGLRLVDKTKLCDENGILFRTEKISKMLHSEVA